MSDLVARLERSLATLRVPSDATIGVACSGGGDSIALLHLVVRSGRRAVVLHVDHQLRGGSAGDARFVSATASALGVPCFVERATVTLGPRTSVEAAARAVRYRALETMAAKASADVVLTAHTRDDQAETVMLRLMRGASLDAIAPVRGIFVRPLLDVTRDEVREWLRSNDLSWREDPTNDDTRFERNWVRKELLPVMGARRPGFAPVLARVAETTRADLEALDEIAARVFARASVDDVGIFLSSRDVEGLPRAVLSRVIRVALRSLGCDPTSSEVERIVELRRGRAGAIDVWRLADGLAFVPGRTLTPAAVALPAEGITTSPEWGIRLRVGNGDAPPWRWRVGVAEAEAEALEIRPRRPGDRVPTRAGTRKVKDVLIDAKVPRPLRALVPIVAAGERVIGVVGQATGSSRGLRVLDVEPYRPTWSRERVWTRT